MTTLKRTLLVVLILAGAISCSPDAVKKPDKELLLSDDILTAVLTETYLAGGVLEVPSIRNSWGKRDSIRNYTDILENHGCSKEQLDATLYYYFASKPKKMARIYDRVIANLLEIEASMNKEVSDEKKIVPENLWTGKTSYNLPDDFTKDPIWFDIPIDSLGTYLFKADYQLYPDDKSLDPKITIYFSIRQKDGKEVTEYWDEVLLVKTGKTQKVELRKTLETPGEAHIRGWLLNHTNQKGIWEKHARIRNIVLKREVQQAMYE